MFHVGLTEALRFLHTSERLTHNNICPEAVLLTHRGQWRLASVAFLQATTRGNSIVSGGSGTEIYSSTASGSPLSPCFGSSGRTNAFGFEKVTTSNASSSSNPLLSSSNAGIGTSGLSAGASLSPISSESGGSGQSLGVRTFS
ncbi:unnamed protein product [Protopolystoma xenopodis]|uniref:Protein kinase domain-containing protein n=1 Tax=Protopolystoma xenopodis TaxID=117903 RepID=A0A3S5AL73_9PLAT|nr:unnamed protein product [Protopolystoma xenopodis]